jgi:hypothetical protein
MDLSTGMTDLCWNLVQIFFLTTLILARPRLGLVEAAGDGDGEPVVVGLSRLGPPDTADDELPVLAVQARGPLTAPTPGESVIDWLAEGCRAGGPISVQLECPADSTHRACQALAVALIHAAPACRVQY